MIPTVSFGSPKTDTRSSWSRHKAWDDFGLIRLPGLPHSQGLDCSPGPGQGGTQSGHRERVPGQGAMSSHAALDSAAPCPALGLRPTSLFGG